MTDKGGTAHKPLHAILIIASLLIYATVILFNAMSSGIFGKDIFRSSVGNISDEYRLEITPSSFVFGVVWPLIYLLLFLVFLYALTTICRRGPSGNPLYVSPTCTPPLMYVFINLSSFTNVGWLFLWDRRLIIFAAFDLACLTLSLYGAIFITAKATKDNDEEYQKNGRRAELWVVRILVHNGLAVYATWVSIATLINSGTVLAYHNGGVSMSMACTLMLAMLAFGVLFWFVMQNFVIAKYVEHIFTPYLVIIFALIGVIHKNHKELAKLNSIFSMVLLGVVSILLAVKVFVFWRRSNEKKPTKGDVEPEKKV